MCWPKKKKKEHVICLTSHLFFHHISKGSDWYPNCFDPPSFSERLINEKLKFLIMLIFFGQYSLYEMVIVFFFNLQGTRIFLD